MSKYTNNEREQAAYLAKMPTDVVVSWLEKNQPEPVGYEIMEMAHNFHNREFIERVLLNRRDPAIDQALARHGCTVHTLSRLYRRNKASLRLAVLKNPYGGFRMPDVEKIIRQGKEDEITLIFHPYIEGSFLCSVLRKKEGVWGRYDFTDLPWDRLFLVVRALRGNPRLKSEEARKDIFDGDDWANYIKPSSALLEIDLPR